MYEHVCPSRRVPDFRDHFLYIFFFRLPIVRKLRSAFLAFFKYYLILLSANHRRMLLSTWKFCYFTENASDSEFRRALVTQIYCFIQILFNIQILFIYIIFANIYVKTALADASSSSQDARCFKTFNARVRSKHHQSW